MKLAFKSINASGETIEGVSDAFDQFALARELRSRGQSLVSAHALDEKKAWNFARVNEMVVRVSLKDKMVFASNLAAMLGAGLPLARALAVLERQTRNLRLKRAIREVESSITKGKTLHDAFADYPRIFSPVFVAMVHAGEESGNLPQALAMISAQLDKTYTMRRKIRGALMYPAVVMMAMVIIGVLMMIYVVPTLAATFAEFGKQLPPMTRVILATSDFLVHHTATFIVSVLAFVAFVTWFLRTRFGTRMVHWVALRLPIIGVLVREVNAALTARTIGALVSSGVDMVKAIGIAQDVVQNGYYKDVLVRAQEEIVKGKSLASIFEEEEKLFPPLVGEMAQVGEETGKLTEMLMNVAVFYEGEVDAATKNMSTIIEPFLMLMIGGAVGFFAIAMIQPIYSLTMGV